MNNKLGCHVSMCAPNYLLGSLEEAIKMNANCFMIYTGSPQSLHKPPIEKMRIDEFKLALEKANINLEDVIVHCPYIMNLANNDPTKRSFAIKVLDEEIKRCSLIGCKYLVLHPGNNVSPELGCKHISFGINQVNKHNSKIIICLETMAGKGNEIGCNFKQLKQIIDMIEKKELIGVCLDTCHLNDSGTNVADVTRVLKEFDKEIGLKYLKILHINDSLNSIGARKDRHANIGKGTIGSEVLKSWVNHPLTKNLPKILETPHINNQPIYDKEIRMLLK